MKVTCLITICSDMMLGNEYFFAIHFHFSVQDELLCFPTRCNAGPGNDLQRNRYLARTKSHIGEVGQEKKVYKCLEI
jgi:hypothetical protein